MKHLVYCIYRKESGRSAEEPLKGVDGHSVREVEAGDLAAAVSCISAPVVSPNIATMSRYHAVIAHFHRCCTVIPLRFGALLDSEPDVERLLQNQSTRYQKLLEELQGGIEMGIRVIVPDRKQSPGTLLPSAQFCSSETRTPGQSYLASRKARYVEGSLLAEKNAKDIRLYIEPFAGMYSKTKSEISRVRQNRYQPVKSTLLSLYFLIPKDSLGDFRRAFGRLKLHAPAKMLLSGPWPPYNFVLPSDSPPQDSGRLSP
jgi:hypothetical protein